MSGWRGRVSLSAHNTANRLVRIGYKAQPGRNTQFRYDGLGRRTATLSNNGAASTETRHLWCGDSLCQSRTAADTVTRRYYPEGELCPQGNTLLYYHRDHLGSVRDVTNLPNAARIAARIAAFDYGPYGTPAQTSGRLSTDFRYAGMFYLQEAGLYLTRHRAYDPDNARWLSRDPIGEAGGINLYGYVGGDPVNWVDPLGLNPITGAIEGAELGVVTCGPYCGIAGGIIGGIVGSTISDYIYNALSTSNPLIGKPGSEVECSNKKGNPKQTRRYGSDNFPETDTDWDHSHDGLGSPHVHDWGRPTDGSQPTNLDRGVGRKPKPGDPGIP